MKREHAYYMAAFLLIVIAINFIGAVGIEICGTIERNKINKEYKKYRVPNEVLIARQKYEQYYEPKIDSLLDSDPIKAIDFINHTIDLYPEKYILELYKGVAYYNIDSLNIALSQFKKSMEKGNYEFSRALGYSGWTLAELGRYDEAIEELNKAASINSDYYYDIASVYEMSGDSLNAIKYYEIVIDKLRN